MRHTDSSELAQVNDLIRGFEGEVLAHIVTAATGAPDRRNIRDDEANAGRELFDFCRQLIG
ncbi:MAG TPA: hypothetical protein VE826_01085 [Dongiaceae bacterium]|nr:hypothetical protein [Dongiaceae bacterium]